MITHLFNISITAFYRGTQEIYSAQAVAVNGENLYQPVEAITISGALEKMVQQIKVQEQKSASYR